MNKKGLSTGVALLLIGIVGFGYLFLASPSISKSGGVQFNAQGACTPLYEIELSGITSGVSHLESGNNHELIVTSADLNSENLTAIGFTIASSRKDSCRAADGSFLQTVIEYDCNGLQFVNVDDSTDSSKYYTVEWEDETNMFNLSCDGTAYCGVNTVTDIVTLSSAGSGAIASHVEDFTTLNKGIKDDFTKKPVMTCDIKNSESNAIIGTVTLNYMQG